MTDFISQLERTVSASYDIERELSGGGMSRVFLATERALGRRVVIKVLPPDLAAGVNMERFRREIQLAAQLHHPHIVPLLSTGEGNGILYYTMPYIEGESLRLAVERTGRLAVADVIRVLHDVVDALAYAHGRGVIHRDIKPANILRLGSHALVTDFGVAKALSAAMPISGVTTAGIAIGTPAYMAPEQLAGDPAADHRIDIYAVGLLAYELLIGSSPFSSSSPQATMAAQLTRTPEPLYELRPEVPSDLSDLIMRCLEKNPAFRPATAAALQAELDAVTTPRGAVLNGAEPDFFAVQRQSTARGALMGAAVVVLASIATYGFVAFRGDEDNAAADTTPVVVAPPVPPAPARAARPAPPVDSARIAAAFSGAAPGGGTGAATPAPPATPQGVVLSRADSLAIAEAVTARLQSERGSRDQVISDSVRTIYERAFSDSIRRAIAQIQLQVQAATDIGQRVRIESQRGERYAPLAPPRPDERRVVVVPFSNPASGNRLSTTGAGDQIADSIRSALSAGGTLTVVNEDMTREIARMGRVPTMIGAVLHAPAIVTGEYTRRGDSLVVRAQVTCLTCGVLGIREAIVPVSEAITAVPLLLDPLLRDLARVRWTSPSRSGSGRGGPPSGGTRFVPGTPPPTPPPPPSP